MLLFLTKLVQLIKLCSSISSEVQILSWALFLNTYVRWKKETTFHTRVKQVVKILFYIHPILLVGWPAYDSRQE